MTSPNKHYAVIMGARPNFVKAAPFFREAKKHENIRLTSIHTGQHFDQNMSRIFFDEMQIPKPDIYLDIKGEHHTEKIGKMFDSLKRALGMHNFDGVVVFGDVNSTLAGAVAALSNNLNLFHIEAGLRSHDRRMPEEINRVIVDHVSSLLFITDPSASKNLKKEGVEEEKIKHVGNIMIESLELFKDKVEKSQILETLEVEPRQYVVVTIHRQENTDDPKVLEKILQMLEEGSQEYTLVWPLHPGTKKKIELYKLQSYLSHFLITDPLGYFDFMKLVMGSNGVITDSGGIQEETTHLGISCCTVRDNTERPITVEQGSNKLFSISQLDAARILKHLKRNDFKSGHIPLWDGGVSKRIFEHL